MPAYFKRADTEKTEGRTNPACLTCYKKFDQCPWSLVFSL